MDKFKLSQAQLEKLSFADHDDLIFADMRLSKPVFLTKDKTITVLEGKADDTEKIIRLVFNTLNDELEEFEINENVDLDLPVLGEINFVAVSKYSKVIFVDKNNTWQDGFRGMLKKETDGNLIFNVPISLEKVDDDKYKIIVDWSAGAAPDLGDLSGLLMPVGKSSDLMSNTIPESLKKAVVLSELTFLLAPKSTEAKAKMENATAEFLFNATDNWMLFEGIDWLDITNLKGKITVEKPLYPVARRVNIEFNGSLLLGAAGSQAEVKITASGEDYSVTGELQDGNSIPLGDILQNIGLPIIGPAAGDDKLIISALSFEAQPKNGTYSFNKVRVENLLKFQIAGKELFSLKSLEATLAVTKESEVFSTTATIDAEMDLLGEEIVTNISVAGTDELDDDGKKVNPFEWKVIAKAKKINVFKMVERLLSTASDTFSLPESLEALNLDDAEIKFDITSGEFLLEGKFKKLWPVGDVNLNDVDFYLHYKQSDGFEVKFTAMVAIGEAATGTDVKVEFAYYNGAWVLDGNTTKAVKLQNIANSITGSTKYLLPGPLKTVSISHLGVHLEKTDSKFVFSTTATVVLDDFPITGKTSEINLDLEVVKNANNSKSLNIGGLMTVSDLADASAAPHIFKVAFSKNDKSNALFATYQGNFPLVNIIKLFENADQPGTKVSSLIPNWFSPTVTGASFLMVTNPDTEKDATILFNMDMTMGEVNLQDMDLVGSYIGDFPIVPKVAISVCTNMLTKEEVDSLNVVLLEIQDGSPADKLTIVADGKDAAQNDIKCKGFTANLSLNDTDANELAGQAGKLKKLLPNISQRSFSFAQLFTPAGDEPAKGATEEKTKWSSARKQYGPLFVNKLGVSLDDGKLNLLLDGGLNIGGFTFSLLNLGVKVPMQMPFDITKIEFGLDGLAINYVNGGLKIVGAFLAQKVLYEGFTCKGYFGEIQLKVGDKSFKAIGCYIHPDKDHIVNGKRLAPSFFLFAAVNIPIGGPSFFFVTGFAAGFGINSSLNIPSIDNLRDFVLLKIVFEEDKFDDADPGANITKITRDIKPKLDSYWMAVGVKATHFVVVESFFLLTVEFGNRLEINLLGLMKIVLPPPGDKIVKAELAVRARFLPNEGILSIEGRVSPGSYVLNPMAKLGGGFAFMIWMKGHGAIKAGDFVLSLGGYHPNFKPPSHYPVVPRLSLNWQLNSRIFIKGEMYFAITPNVLMAGGRLEARADLGIIQAWFIAEAHFLVNFSPFYYNVTISVSMGARITLDLWFVTITKSFSFSARLELWGPDFGGHAVIDLSIVEFEISFGTAKAPPAPLNWEQFQIEFLPKVEEIVVTTVSEGLVKDFKGNPEYGDLDYVLNPTEMKLIVESAVPILEFNDVDTGSNDIGILAMDLERGELSSSMHLDIINELGKSELENFITAGREFSNVPIALWGGGNDRGSMNAPDKLVRHVSKGLSILPKQKDEVDFDSLPHIDLESLTNAVPEPSGMIFGFSDLPVIGNFNKHDFGNADVSSANQDILDLLNDDYGFEGLVTEKKWGMDEDDWRWMESSTTFVPTGVV